MESEVLFLPDGTARFIYDDVTHDVMAEVGTLRTARASYVEPVSVRHEGRTETWWEADMRAVGGPVFGPYAHRSMALGEEVVWLKANGLPLPEELR